MCYFEYPTFKAVQKELMRQQNVKTPTELKIVDTVFTMKYKKAEWEIEIKDKRVFSNKLTPKYKKMEEAAERFGKKMEKLAEKLQPGHENYCYHHDKKKVYFGGDWEEDDMEEDEFGIKGLSYTVEQLTTGFKSEKQKLQNKFIEDYKDRRSYSFNQVIQLFAEFQKNKGESFEKWLEVKFVTHCKKLLKEEEEEEMDAKGEAYFNDKD